MPPKAAATLADRGQLRANSRPVQSQQTTQLLDNLVGNGDYARRDRQTESLGRLHVDD